MSNAIYRALNLESNEIRLLALQPGEGASPVQAVLTYASLSDNPKYEALSYAWGDCSITRPIQLRAVGTNHGSSDTSEVQVTTNLESALRHLRFKDRTRILWADALCINQDDVVEKGHQVRHMGDIYRKSSCVCLWIGEEANDSDAAMDLIEWYRTGNRSDEETLWNDLRWATAFRALTYLVSRPWFTRRWIVQEILLSEKSVVYCGTKSTTWRSLWLATRSLETETSNLLIHRGTGDRATQLPVSHAFSKWDIPDQRVDAWRQGLKNIIEIYHAQLVVTRDPFPPLMTLLRTLQRKAVTDPRDAVYALLSLSKEGRRSQMYIDYSAPVMDVFRDTVELSIRGDESLDIICLSFGFAGCGHSDTWIPRFYTVDEGCHCRTGQDLPHEGRPIQSKSAYSASGCSKAVVSIEGRKLVAKCILIDCIQNKLENTGFETRLTHIRRLWKESALSLDPMCIGGSSRNAVFTNDPALLFEAFWRTLVTNRTRVKKIEKPPQSWGLWFEAWSKGNMILKWLITEDEDIQSKTDAIHVAMRRSVAYRHFIVTEMKRIGLAPRYAREGDLICILLGCSVPVILRPAFGPGNAGLYHFIGDSYIHGIMDGEVMTSLENGDYTLEEFNII